MKIKELLFKKDKKQDALLWHLISLGAGLLIGYAMKYKINSLAFIVQFTIGVIMFVFSLFVVLKECNYFEKKCETN